MFEKRFIRAVKVFVRVCVPTFKTKFSVVQYIHINNRENILHYNSFAIFISSPPSLSANSFFHLFVRFEFYFFRCKKKNLNNNDDD